MIFVVVQLLSRVRLFATPWTEARQASLSFTIFWSLLNSCRLTSCHLVFLVSFSRLQSHMIGKILIKSDDQSYQAVARKQAPGQC